MPAELQPGMQSGQACPIHDGNPMRLTHLAILKRPRAILLAMIGALALVSACEQIPDAALEPQNTGPDKRSDESVQLQRYYASVQTKLQTQGLLRTDGGGPDVPFTATTLAQNFERITLFDEYAIRGGRFVAQQTPSHLRRWERPIRVGLLFGDQVPEAQRAIDRENVAAYVRRLSRLTGVNMTVSNANPNFHVMFLYRDEQKNIGPLLRQRIPDLGQVVIDEITQSPRNTFCVAYAFSDQNNSSSYTSALILVKAEHTDLMRLSCIHEEMAQAMGLANDSPTARPSIFNDDEEFALLTRQDELLLRMLYDKRLKPGMTPQAARPLLPIIANDVLRSG